VVSLVILSAGGRRSLVPGGMVWSGAVGGETWSGRFSPGEKVGGGSTRSDNFISMISP